MNLVKLFACVIIISSCNAQNKAPNLPVQKDENTLLWEVSGKGLKTPSYIFGTFHLMCKNDIHFGQPLKEAIQYAKEVYLEMDMDDPSVLLGGMLLMKMKDGKKLQDLYTAEEFKRLSEYFKDSVGMPMSFLETMKPAMMEALLYPKMLDCKTSTGVEMELMVLAKQNKKEIKGLETIEFQSSVFDSIPYEAQAKQLLKAINSVSAYKKYFDKMVQVYKSQRIADLDTLMNDSDFNEDMSANGDILLYNRNRNWVTQLKNIMPKESVFVAVGAGHLVGGKGLIALLKKEGYTLKPIAN